MKDYSYSEIENGINEWIVGRNAARDRMIMRYWLIDGYSANRISNILKADESLDESDKLEPRQIQRIISKRRTVLFRHI